MKFREQEINSLKRASGAGIVHGDSNTERHVSSQNKVARWCQIWQILPKVTFFQKFANFVGNIFYAKILPFFEISIVSIDKTIHFGLFIK